MPRYIIKIQYDGHLFKGWQIQNDQRTVQETIENSISVIAKHEIKITGSGRTDSGVHALGQVAHFDLDFEIRPEALIKAINSKLPNDVLITAAKIVDDNFSARYDAYKRTYIYRFSTDQNPFQRHHVSLIKRKRYDEEIFKLALKKFIGKHDFFSFSKFNPEIKSTICEVDHIAHRSDIPVGVEEVTISADRFLHNMVRRIIGTSINIGHEKEDPALITDLLCTPVSENRIIYTAPPEGLYLLKVSYPNVDF